MLALASPAIAPAQVAPKPVVELGDRGLTATGTDGFSYINLRFGRRVWAS